MPRRVPAFLDSAANDSAQIGRRPLPPTRGRKKKERVKKKGHQNETEPSLPSQLPALHPPLPPSPLHLLHPQSQELICIHSPTDLQPPPHPPPNPYIQIQDPEQDAENEGDGSTRQADGEDLLNALQIELNQPPGTQLGPLLENSYAAPGRGALPGTQPGGFEGQQQYSGEAVMTTSTRQDLYLALPGSDLPTDGTPQHGFFEPQKEQGEHANGVGQLSGMDETWSFFRPGIGSRQPLLGELAAVAEQLAQPEASSAAHPTDGTRAEGIAPGGWETLPRCGTPGLAARMGSGLAPDMADGSNAQPVGEGSSEIQRQGDGDGASKEAAADLMVTGKPIRMKDLLRQKRQGEELTAGGRVRVATPAEDEQEEVDEDELGSISSDDSEGLSSKSGDGLPLSQGGPRKRKRAMEQDVPSATDARSHVPAKVLSMEERLERIRNLSKELKKAQKVAGRLKAGKEKLEKEVQRVQEVIAHKPLLDKIRAAGRLCTENDAPDVLVLLADALISGSLPLGSIRFHRLVSLAANSNKEFTNQLQYSDAEMRYFATLKRQSCAAAVLEAMRGPMNMGGGHGRHLVRSAKITEFVPSLKAIERYEKQLLKGAQAPSDVAGGSNAANTSCGKAPEPGLEGGPCLRLASDAGEESEDLAAGRKPPGGETLLSEPLHWEGLPSSGVITAGTGKAGRQAAPNNKARALKAKPQRQLSGCSAQAASNVSSSGAPFPPQLQESLDLGMGSSAPQTPLAATDLRSQHHSNLVHRQLSDQLLQRQLSDQLLQRSTSDQLLRRQRSDQLLQHQVSSEHLLRRQVSDQLLQRQVSDHLKRQVSDQLLQRPHQQQLPQQTGQELGSNAASRWHNQDLAMVADSCHTVDSSGPGHWTLREMPAAGGRMELPNRAYLPSLPQRHQGRLQGTPFSRQLEESLHQKQVQLRQSQDQEQREKEGVEAEHEEQAEVQHAEGYHEFDAAQHLQGERGLDSDEGMHRSEVSYFRQEGNFLRSEGNFLRSEENFLRSAQAPQFQGSLDASGLQLQPALDLQQEYDPTSLRGDPDSGGAALLRPHQLQQFDLNNLRPESDSLELRPQLGFAPYSHLSMGYDSNFGRYVRDPK